MPASIGVNLRVTGHSKQGGRKYMEDYFSVAYQQTDDERDLEYAYFGIFDGHGGCEAATYAKDHLMEAIVREREFWSDKDEDVLKAIREGFINTHMAMWKEQAKWPKTASGLPSTAGTTASIAFIRRGKIYTGHVGDSGIVLGFRRPGSTAWEARRLTKDHKPESRQELMRIEQCGGKVVWKSGVPRVVWYRPQLGHKGPITRSTPFDEIPFLAVARSLGDLWSYNSTNNEFVVSPEPDTNVIPIDLSTFRCLIFGSDGLWNMISPSTAVNIVQAAEQNNAMSVLTNNPWINPSMSLVERALERWTSTRMRADNTSVVTLMLDPPGPPRAQVILQAQRLLSEPQRGLSLNGANPTSSGVRTWPSPTQESHTRVEYPENGLQILTRYDTKKEETGAQSTDNAEQNRKATEAKYTEEYLDQIHRELYDSTAESLCSYADSTQTAMDVSVVQDEPTEKEKDDNSKEETPDAVGETIQINVVSSSSDHEKPLPTTSDVKKLPKVQKMTQTDERSCVDQKFIYKNTRSRSFTKLTTQTPESSPQRNGAFQKPKVPKKSVQNIRRSRSLEIIKTVKLLDGRAVSPSLSPQMRVKSSSNSVVSKSVTTSTPWNKKAQKRPNENSNFTIEPKLKRSKSLGPKDLIEDKRLEEKKNVNEEKKELTESKLQTAKKSKSIVSLNGNISEDRKQSRSSKRDRSNDAENSTGVKRSRSLGSKDPLDGDKKSGNLKKKQENISDVKQRSRSLGAKELSNEILDKVEKRSVKETPETVEKKIGRLKKKDLPEMSLRSRSLVTKNTQEMLSKTLMKKVLSDSKLNDGSESLIVKNIRLQEVTSVVKFTRSRSLGSNQVAKNSDIQNQKAPDKADKKGSIKKNEFSEKGLNKSNSKETENKCSKQSSTSRPRVSLTEINLLVSVDMKSNEGNQSQNIQTRSKTSSVISSLSLASRKLKDRSLKRERNENDDENITSPPRIKRSRSLGPGDFIDFTGPREFLTSFAPDKKLTNSERNLKERNVIDTKNKKWRSSMSDIGFSPPQTRYKGRRSIK